MPIPESDNRIQIACGGTVDEFEKSAECSIRIQNAKACAGGGWELGAEWRVKYHNPEYSGWFGHIGDGPLRKSPVIQPVISMVFLETVITGDFHGSQRDRHHR